MDKRIFTDQNGEQLIVHHRKSAVFFLRETDLSIDGYVSRYSSGQTPIVHPEETKRKYQFSQETFKEFVNYMKQIAYESWKEFSPKIADSLRADYEKYYDREFGTEGSLKIRKNQLQVKGPHQVKTSEPIIRLYKFDKPRFESFIYDLEKLMES